MRKVIMYIYFIKERLDLFRWWKVVRWDFHEGQKWMG